MGLHSKTELAPRSDENYFRVSVGRVSEHVGPPRHPRRRRVFCTIERRQWLPRQHEHGRLMAELDNIAVGLDDFVGIARPQDHQSRDGTQRYKLFHWLMSRTVLSITHGIVREHEESGQFHQGRKTDGRARVVAEDKERCAEGTELGQRETVDNRGHGMLANAKMQVLPARAVGLEVASTVEFQSRLVGWS